MAVIKVTENWKGLSAEISGSVEGETGSAQRKFDVQFDTADNPAGRPIIALEADDGGTSIPAIWDEHPYYTDWYVKKVSSTQKNSPVLFDVTVDYEYIEDPVNRNPTVQWLFASSNEPFDKDKDDNPVTNSSDEPFDPPPSKDVHDLVLRYVRNEASFNASTASSYKGSVNSDIWNGWPAGQVKCTVYDAVEKKAGALTYYEVTYEFQFRPAGWQRKFLDHGFREKIGTDKDSKPVFATITDKEGNPVTQPVHLDGSGKKLTSGGTPVFRSFEVAETIGFAGLGITLP